jgi:hypothetical protein
MTDRLSFEYSPEDLYMKLGFRTLDQLKDYGKTFDKIYTGDNLHDAYKLIFNKDIDVQFKSRSIFFTEDIPEVLTYRFILEIGHSEINTSAKTTKHKIPIEWPSDSRNVHLQITAILYSDIFHDNIICNILNYSVEAYGILLSVGSYKIDNTYWSLELRAHLTVNILEDNILSIKNE